MWKNEWVQTADDLKIQEVTRRMLGEWTDVYVLYDTHDAPTNYDRDDITFEGFIPDPDALQLLGRLYRFYGGTNHVKCVGIIIMQEDVAAINCGNPGLAYDLFVDKLTRAISLADSPVPFGKEWEPILKRMAVGCLGR